MNKPLRILSIQSIHAFVGAMLAVLCLLAGMANLVRFATKHATGIGLADAMTMFSYALLMVSMIWWCRSVAPLRNERRIVAIILTGSLLLKLGLVFSLGHILQTGDRLFLSQFIDRWVDGNSAALRDLSWEYYDYPLWFGRAWPFLYPLRLWMSESFIIASQILNAFISTLLCAFVYLFVRPYVRRPLIPLVLAVLSTTYTWQVVEYGYLFQGGIFLLAGMYVLNHIRLRHTSKYTRLVWPVILQSLIYFLLFLQQGLELVLVAVSFAFSVYSWFASRSVRSFVLMLIFSVLLPVAISYPAMRTVKQYYKHHDEGQLSSHFIGHMAMGWNMVTWGEYYGPVVALDRRTPLDQKNRVMMDYLVDKIRSRPFDALVKLPIIKVIKLFQVGAASGAEENLFAAGNMHWLGVAKSTRIVFAPFLLFFAAIGSVRFFSRNGEHVFSWALLVLAFVFAYTFFSETSPRYSFFFMFVLIACATEGIDYTVSFFNQPQRARTIK